MKNKVEFEVLKRLENVESLDELFEIWKQEGGVRETFEVFCEDGIIDARRFHKRRILFVRKDLHLEDKGKYLQLGKIDMRKHVCEKEDWRT